MEIDKSEEKAALIDLVEGGAGLFRSVDCLLKDIQKLSGISTGENSEFNSVS